MNNLHKFIPMTKEEILARGWDEIDILLINGDAYVDHPSFGISLIARYLERHGFRVAIISQPRAVEDLKKFGVPKLFVGISSGVVDSMVNNYTANKKKRSDDMYSEGGLAGKRPDNAVIVYSGLAKTAFPNTPIIIGGIEASVRRLAYYDYWQNKIAPSILINSKADILVYGMGEKQILEIAKTLKDKNSTETIKNIRGIAYLDNKDAENSIQNRLLLPSFEEVKKDKKKFLRTAVLIEAETNPHNAKTIVQYHAGKAVVVTPPALPLSTKELDDIYELPFSREPHFIYKKKIPAAEMIFSSITINRGCFGGCSFCALSVHQGKIIQSRSIESVIREITALSNHKDFKGIVSDVGGPTANMYKLGCKDVSTQNTCKRPSCLFPEICKNLNTDHSLQIELLKNIRALKKVRKVLIASGIRYDLALKDEKYLNELIRNHVGGHLKVAPEHIDDEVLSLMRKSSFSKFLEFKNRFETISKNAGKDQYIVPYLISAFPGCTPEKMQKLSLWLKKQNWKVQQVQSFIPLPMTLAAAMFHCELSPYSKKPIYVAKSYEERKLQQALLQPNRAHHKWRVNKYLRHR